MQKWRISTTISHLYSVRTSFPASSNQSKWMREAWGDGTVAWLAVSALPCICEFMIFSCIFSHKNTISYLIPIQSGPFQRSSLSSYTFLSIGMREEVGGTITAGERVSAASEMHVRIFSLLMMPVAVGKAAVNGLEKATGQLMPLGVERMLAEFGGTWLGANIYLQKIGEVTVYFATHKS
jgi:hypothetical protein